MPEIKNVTAGKPKVTGSIYRAKAGSTLPADAKEELDTAFKALGYVSEDGVSNSNTPESEKIKAWGGDVVMMIQTGKEDKFKFKLIETLNVDVMKTVYGDNNVTGDIDSGIAISANGNENEEYAWVIDMIMRGGVLKRIVIPSASITELGDINYKDKEATGYDVTITATPDSEGNTHYEYVSARTVTAQTTAQTTAEV